MSTSHLALGGDFRQILPVVRHGRREDIVHAVINKSYLWKYCRSFKLHTNMRLLQKNINPLMQNSLDEFVKWILKISDGDLAVNTVNDTMHIPTDILLTGFDKPIETIVFIHFLIMRPT